MQDDEILGKAYDSRLMKRLLGYLRPYGWQVTVGLTAIVLKAAADVIGPYLTKTAIDKYLASGIGRPHGLLDSWLSSDPLKGIGPIGMLYIGAQLACFVLEYTQTYLMQWTGQTVMFDLRSPIFRHLPRMSLPICDTKPAGPRV